MMESSRHGPLLLPGGGVRFRLWAPTAKNVALLCDGQAPQPMSAQNGWYSLDCKTADPGIRYRFLIDSELQVPDPASRSQPDGIGGPSVVTGEDGFAWDDAWRGRPWIETVVSELHVGAFSSEGTYAGIEKRLDHLADCGITAIELMPIATFPGRFGWGYDGVLPFAPFAGYGTAADLKNLITAAHRRGIMVFLDVVYNHFGPEGNFLWRYATPFFTEAHHTPWGAAINFEGEAGENVRRFFIENALYWLHEFRFDGLRFDAVHAIRDDSERHFLAELAASIRAELPPDRHVHLILENDRNEACWLERDHDRPALFTAQWNDDFHHNLHYLLTDEQEGYYAEYAADPVAQLGRCLTEGFMFQGQPSAYRDNEPRGEPSAHLPPSAFIAFLQNHDQIGNRAFGERLATLADERKLTLVSALLLLGPQIPMLFMGEEWYATTPFCYFCDFDGPLGDAVRQGRHKEFEKFPAFQTEAAQALIPDPTSDKTFFSSRLDWTQPKHEPFHSRLAFTRTLLEKRRKHIIPHLVAGVVKASFDCIAGKILRCEWHFKDNAVLRLVANFSDADLPHPLTGDLTHIWGHFGDELPAWKCAFALEQVL